jgi:hypothetical protein
MVVTFFLTESFHLASRLLSPTEFTCLASLPSQLEKERRMGSLFSLSFHHIFELLVTFCPTPFSIDLLSSHVYNHQVVEFQNVCFASRNARQARSTRCGAFESGVSRIKAPRMWFMTRYLQICGFGRQRRNDRCSLTVYCNKRRVGPAEYGNNIFREHVPYCYLPWAIILTALCGYTLVHIQQEYEELIVVYG